MTCITDNMKVVGRVLWHFRWPENSVLLAARRNLRQSDLRIGGWTRWTRLSLPELVRAPEGQVATSATLPVDATPVNEANDSARRPKA